MTIRHGQINIKKSTSKIRKSSSKLHHSLNKNVIQLSDQKQCYFCEKIIIHKSDELTCLNKNCLLVTHLYCLANAFLKQNEGHYIPISGNCPLCARYYLWNNLLLKQKNKIYDLDNMDDEDYIIDYDFDGDLTVQPEVYFDSITDD